MNSVISKWLGECRHEWVKKGRPHFHDYNCTECNLWENTPLSQAPDYENDESAWSQELWDKIERDGLCHTFRRQLEIAILKDKGDFISLQWEVIRATPAQKAAALSRAIEEAG